VSRRALVVDDDLDFRRLIVPILSRKGFQVVEAGSAAQATAAVESSEGFELFVVDGVLPDKSGVGWLADRRDVGDTTAAVYVTAFPHDVRTLNKLTAELGVKNVLYKPIIPSVFATLVDNMVKDSAIVPVAGTIQELTDEYRSALPQRIKELAHAVRHARDNEDDPVAWGEARIRAHRLRGVAGTYGFDRVGDAAGRIEDSLRRLLDREPRVREMAWQRIDEALEEATRAAMGDVARPTLPGAATARLLVVEEDPECRKFLEELGRQQLLQVTAVATPADALTRARSEAFDAALIDTGTRRETAISLAQDLRALVGYERLPLAFLSSDASMECRVAAAHAGASLYLSKPIDAYAFSTAVQHLLSLRSEERTRILVVDDDPDFADCISDVLSRDGMLVTTLSDASRVLETAEDISPDLVLLDVMLPTWPACSAPRRAGVTCPSCSSPAGAIWSRAWPPSSRAATTTWPSPSSRRSSWRACACASIEDACSARCTRRIRSPSCSRGARSWRASTRASPSRAGTRGACPWPSSTSTTSSASTTFTGT
jgi:DNA-binding response OmpR family regulator